MKKTLKVLMVALISLMVLFGFSQPISLAKPDVNTVIEDVESSEATTPEEVTTVGGTIINWIWGFSIVIAVIVLMIIGVKFIIGSASEKAECKKSLMPLVVGIVILVFSTTIVKILFSMG